RDWSSDVCSSDLLLIIVFHLFYYIPHKNHVLEIETFQNRSRNNIKSHDSQILFEISEVRILEKFDITLLSIVIVPPLCWSHLIVLQFHQKSKPINDFLSCLIKYKARIHSSAQDFDIVAYAFERI